MTTVEASSRPAVGTSYIPSRSNNLAEINPNEDRYTNIRPPPYPRSQRFSMSSNISGLAGSNTRSRSHSKADSISTLWSSAEVPLYLDTSMERSESAGSRPLIGPSKMSSSFLPTRSSSNGPQPIADDEEEQEELSILMDERPALGSSPHSSDVGQYGTSRRDSSHRQQIRPPPLNLHRDTSASSVPTSVSLSSGSQMITPVQDNSNIIDTSKQLHLPPQPPSQLYQKAERFFSLSYTMTPPSSAEETSTECFAKTGQFDEDSFQSPIKAMSPSYSYSRDSRSSTESSSILPDTDSYNNRLNAMATMTKTVSQDEMTSSPLRVAVGLTTDNVLSRQHSSISTPAAGSPRTKSPSNLHPGMAADHEAIRNCKEGEEPKYSFLDSPAPLIAARKSSVSSRKMSLFNAKLRTSSTPKLRNDKQLPEISYESQEITREHRENSRAYPPQAPSGRFRSRTLGESELCEPLQRANSKSGSTHRTSQDSQRPSRRPSNSEPLSTMAARLRRPSKANTISSSHYNSSVNSVNNLNEAYEQGPARVDRAFSTTSSQFFVDSAGNKTSGVSTFLKKAAGNPPTQSKSKGGWASHLTQGLTLHIEQGSKRYTIKMNYLSYDPFGKPESLCNDRPMTPSRPKSKNGNQQEDEITSSDSVGLLEFDPQIETEGSTTADRLTLDATADAPILKHLVIGNDVKGDLITRQANLSLGNIGTREVSGSERKGRVTWRFVYGVEDCRLDSGEIVTGMKTLRPLSFTCSATLLDPSRAKKSRVINIIRKQIGANIESMPMPTARSASVTSSTYLQPVPALASPTSSQSSSLQNSPKQRNYSPVTSSNNTNSPSRSAMTPFKLTRPMIEAIAARNKHSGEVSPSTSQAPSSPRGGNTFLTRKSSLLPSPLSCNFQVDRSPKAYVAGGRLLAPHQIKVRPRGSSVGKEAKGALGLDLNGDNGTSQRRIRPSTSQGELKRPTTASEEIKQAYLLQSSKQSANSMPTSPGQIPQYQITTPSNLISSHHQHGSHTQRRPSNTEYTTTSTTTTRQQPNSPVTSNQQRRQTKPKSISTKAGPPEGPFWL